MAENLENNSNITNEIPPPILVVEDSAEDFEVLEYAFKKAQFDVPLLRCKDGQDALEFLYNEKECEHSKTYTEPTLILLDLNMPGMDGQTFLETIKDDMQLRHIPIIVLSTSSNHNDIYCSYLHGANSYLEKPEDIKNYVNMIEGIRNYWFALSERPTKWNFA